MNECKDCRYWAGQTSRTESAVCQLLSGPGLFNRPRRAITTSPDHRYATVATAADFGCADFAERPLEETSA